MKESLNKLKDILIIVIDFFYPLFKKWMDKQTFRYAACGGTNTLLDIVLYFVTYNFILKKEIIQLENIAVSPHIAAFLLTFPITFISGFLFSRYIVFPESSGNKKRIQLAKYLSVVFICILLNYGFLKLFVEELQWWPLPSKLVTTVFVVAFSYLAQKLYTFSKSVA